MLTGCPNQQVKLQANIKRLSIVSHPLKSPLEAKSAMHNHPSLHAPGQHDNTLVFRIYQLSNTALIFDWPVQITRCKLPP